MATKPTEIILQQNQQGDLLFDLINAANIFYNEHDKTIEIQFQASGPKNPPQGDPPVHTKAVIIEGDLKENGTEKTISYKVAAPTFEYRKLSGSGSGEKGIYKVKLTLS